MFFFDNHLSKNHNKGVKKDSRTSFWSTFSERLSHKNLLIYYSINQPSFNIRFQLISKIPNNMCFSFSDIQIFQYLEKKKH